MTLEEAKANIYRPVTAAYGDTRYNGKIQKINEEENLVGVNFDDGNKGDLFWYVPEDLSFGWTGDHYKPAAVEPKPAPDLSAYVGYNLNHPVLVLFDDRAFDIWKRMDDARLDFAPKDIREKLIKPVEHYKSRVNPDGYVEMQFNELMWIFGDYCRIGHEVFSMNVLLPKSKIEQL